MKLSRTLAASTFALAALTLIALPAHAQSGCVNSPENPTLILSLVGLAGAAVPILRARSRG